MAAIAARNSALRGGSRKARPPTGTNSSEPSPLEMPPQACSSSIKQAMSMVAWKIVWTWALSRRLRTSTTLQKPEAQVKDGDRGEKSRRLDRQAARAAQGIQAEQNQRHQYPVQIEDPQHAPVEADFGGSRDRDARFKCSRALSSRVPVAFAPSA